MKITITTPGKFPPAFHAARYHEQRGELSRIVSAVPHSRSASYGVSRRRNVGISALGAWNHGMLRFGPDALAEQHQVAYSAAFDEIAARMIGACDVVNPWQSTALRTIRAAHARGIPAVLEVASAHVLEQIDILREEAARWGTDLDSSVVARRVVDRTLAEYAEADHIITNSEFARASFIARGTPPSRVTAVLYASERTSASIHRLRPADGRAPRVLFVGGMTLRKGVQYLFDAFRRVDTDSTLRLVGQPHAALIERAGGLPPRAQLAGVRTGAALAAEYMAADVFVLPSVEDGFGLVTLEAMRAGLPVIVSDHAGSAESVRDGVDGFVVPARDVAALAARLTQLVSDANLRRRMGAAAQRSAMSRDWDDYGNERHVRVFAPLLGLSNIAPDTEAIDALAA